MGRARGPGPPRAGSLSVRENVLARLREARGGFVPFSELIAVGWAGREPPRSARAGVSNALTELRQDGYGVAVRYAEAPGAALRHEPGSWTGPAGTSARRPRKCLGGCGKMFDSEGPGNRVCAACAGTERMRSDEPYSLGRL